MALGALEAALPREMYVDEHTWLVERETVLFGQWYCVGRLDDLGLATPSRVVVLDVVGESVLLTSDEHGHLHGAYNVCRHRGSQVVPVLEARTRAPAACPASALRCPYHSWTYALDGRLTKTPHTELAGPDLEGFGLHPVAVEAWCGFVFVHLSPERRGDLGESVRRAGQALANYALAGLVTGARLTYEVGANYKVLLENYNECYHCGPVHPELCRLVPAFAGGGGGLDWEGGSRTADAVELWDLVNQQDWAVCESVQRGMSSRSYRHGWFAPMEDDSLDIRRWLLPLLEGPR